MTEDQSARAFGMASKAVMKELLMALERKGVMSKDEINGLLRTAASSIGKTGNDTEEAANRNRRAYRRTVSVAAVSSLARTRMAVVC